MELFEEVPGTPKKGDGLDHIRGMMGAFAAIGAPVNLMSVLMEFGGIELSTDHRRYLNGPIIQQKSQFAELTPKWMFGMIANERLEIILQEQKEGLNTGWRVGSIEIATAMYPATHDAPMRHEYAEIYLWAAAQASSRHYNKPREYFADIVGHVVEDKDVTERGGRYFYTYQDLCQTIRTRVVNVQAGREKKVRKADLQEKPQEQPKSNEGGVEQLSLF